MKFRGSCEAELPRRPPNFAGQAATASLEIGPRSSEPCGRLALARTLVPACASNSARAHALARRVSAQDRRLHCSAAISQLVAWRSGDACACTGSRSIPAGSLSVVGWCSPVGRPWLDRGPLADSIEDLWAYPSGPRPQGGRTPRRCALVPRFPRCVVQHRSYDIAWLRVEAWPPKFSA